MAPSENGVAIFRPSPILTKIGGTPHAAIQSDIPSRAFRSEHHGVTDGVLDIVHQQTTAHHAPIKKELSICPSLLCLDLVSFLPC